MKLGKEALLAIVESALFVIGAFFFVLVLAIPSNPVWALVFGILFGLAGAIVWLCPLFVRIIKRHKIDPADVTTVSKKIQGADDPENNSYELHRSNAYDNLTDEIVARPEPVPEPKTEPAQPN